MLEQILAFFIESIKSLFFGILLFVVSMIFLPNQIVIWLLRKIKPSIFYTEDKKWRSLFSLVINILLYKNYTDFNQSNELKVKLDRIKSLHSNNEAIKKNIYFLDLCVDTFYMLNFALPHAMGDIDYDIFSEALNYLNNYTQYVTSFEQNENFAENISHQISSLEESFNFFSELRNKPDYTKSDQQKMFENSFTGARDYFKSERDMLLKLLEQNKNEVKLILGDIVNGND